MAQPWEHQYTDAFAVSIHEVKLSRFFRCNEWREFMDMGIFIQEEEGYTNGIDSWIRIEMF